jgi:hypothetical protein
MKELKKQHVEHQQSSSTRKNHIIENTFVRIKTNTNTRERERKRDVPPRAEVPPGPDRLRLKSGQFTQFVHKPTAVAAFCALLVAI